VCKLVPPLAVHSRPLLLQLFIQLRVHKIEDGLHSKQGRNHRMAGGIIDTIPPLLCHSHHHAGRPFHHQSAKKCSQVRGPPLSVLSATSISALHRIIPRLERLQITRQQGENGLRLIPQINFFIESLPPQYSQVTSWHSAFD
jgi:hypothetical protein